MRTGIGFPSYAPFASWIGGSGAFGSYTRDHLSDLSTPSRVWRNAGAGYGSLHFQFADQARPIQLVGLVNHNIPSDGIMRMRLWPGTDQTGAPAVDTGNIYVWPSGGPIPYYRPVRPILLTNPVSAQSGLIEFNSNTQTLIQIGGIELAGWWSWRGIGLGRETGFDPRATTVQVVGAASQVEKEYIPRVVAGEIPFVALGGDTDMALDFMRDRDTASPFVFLQDYDDPTSWARFCFLASNSQLSPLAGAAYRHDRFQFKFTEYLR